MTSYTPTVIRRSDPRRIEIEWSDGDRSVYSPAQLRGLCPCAQCVNEISGKRMNDPESVPQELEQSDLHMIGNYAISMRFSDGHHTGIYTFKYLRENTPELGKDVGENLGKNLGEGDPHGHEHRDPSAGERLRAGERPPNHAPRENDPPPTHPAEGRGTTRG